MICCDQHVLQISLYSSDLLEGSTLSKMLGHRMKESTILTDQVESLYRIGISLNCFREEVAVREDFHMLTVNIVVF